jgi:hypothetical protein
VQGDDDRLLPELYPPSPEQSMSGYYGASVRAALRLVRVAPRGWPGAPRLVAQILLALAGIAFVLAAWVFTTGVLIVSAGGSAIAGGSGRPGGPR